MYKVEMSTYTILVLGDGGVGKSSVTLRFITNGYTDEYEPTIEDFYRKTIRVDDQFCTVEIIDTAGQEEFDSMLDNWIRSSNGVVMVYDIGNKRSFERLSVLYDRIQMVKPQPLIVVGNKCDLPQERRQVSLSDGMILAGQWDSPFIEVSAKEKINEQTCFYELIRHIRQNSEKVEVTEASGCICLSWFRPTKIEERVRRATV